MRKLTSVLLCLVLLSGCGFHLRQASISNLDTVYIKTSPRGTAIHDLLREELETSGVVLATAASNEVASISIIDERRHRRGVSTSSLADAAQFELRMEAEVLFSWLPDTVMLVVERVYSVDSINLTGSYEEQNLLITAMRQDLVRQILAMAEASRAQGSSD